jgi:hypothetical protein
MTTFKDWDNETEKMTIEDLDKYGAALETLLEWPFFKKAFDGFGLPVVKTITLTTAFRKRAKVELDAERKRDVKEAKKTKSYNGSFEVIWSQDNLEITKTKFNEFRVWDAAEVDTVGIYETLTEAKEVARNEAARRLDPVEMGYNPETGKMEKPNKTSLLSKKLGKMLLT